VRLKAARLTISCALFVMMIGASLVHGQNPDSMMPDQSAAKAKQVLRQLIEAQGGLSYVGVRERECEGRRAQFGHSGDLTGFIDFKDYWHYPDKHRVDYSKKGNIIDLFNGDHGWTMDRSGVSEEPPTSVADFQESVKRNIDNLLRVRLKEPGLFLRYGGTDLVDLKEIEWVEITDSEQRVFRLAIDHSSHLLVRSVVITVDENTHERAEDVVVYTNYHLLDGVQTPLQITRERDGRKIYQAFLEGCKYNSGMPDDFFSREALEKRFAEVGSKKEKDKFKNSRN